tara:strand:+ start:784 stop:1188 length:405 start_codon:yes stop_codon:yes gene_type:complete
MIVEIIAIRGVEIDVGSGPVRVIDDPVARKSALREHSRRMEEYKKAYRAENDTFLKRHQSYKSHAWIYTWIPWLLPVWILRPKSWKPLTALLPIPVVLASLGLFCIAEIAAFAATVAAAFAVNKYAAQYLQTTK